MITYNGHEIIPVYNYRDGRSDFEVYKEGADKGMMYARTTVERIKEDIDSASDIDHKLELSIAVELLNSRLDTELALFDQGLLSDKDVEDLIKVIKFIGEVKRKDFYLTQRHKLEEHLESKNYYQ